MPPTSMLLWISLALDHPGTRPEAELTLLRLLQANAKKSSTWPRRHVLTLLSMYILECLLQGMQCSHCLAGKCIDNLVFVSLNERVDTHGSVVNISFGSYILLNFV